MLHRPHAVCQPEHGRLNVSCVRVGSRACLLLLMTAVLACVAFLPFCGCLLSVSLTESRALQVGLAAEAGCLASNQVQGALMELQLHSCPFLMAMPGSTAFPSLLPHALTSLPLLARLEALISAIRTFFHANPSEAAPFQASTVVASRPGFIDLADVEWAESLASASRFLLFLVLCGVQQGPACCRLSGRQRATL